MGKVQLFFVDAQVNCHTELQSLGKKEASENNHMYRVGVLEFLLGGGSYF